tara:strand:+ start:369 stop:542 length:174 start_codon:yes stop_codon:yes gene_type:complete
LPEDFSDSSVLEMTQTLLICHTLAAVGEISANVVAEVCSQSDNFFKHRLKKGMKTLK